MKKKKIETKSETDNIQNSNQNQNQNNFHFHINETSKQRPKRVPRKTQNKAAPKTKPLVIILAIIGGAFLFFVIIGLFSEKDEEANTNNNYYLEPDIFQQIEEVPDPEMEAKLLDSLLKEHEALNKELTAQLDSIKDESDRKRNERWQRQINNPNEYIKISGIEHEVNNHIIDMSFSLNNTTSSIIYSGVLVRLTYYDDNDKIKGNEDIYVNCTIQPKKEFVKNYRGRAISEKFRIEVISAKAEIIR